MAVQRADMASLYTATHSQLWCVFLFYGPFLTRSFKKVVGSQQRSSSKYLQRRRLQMQYRVLSTHAQELWIKMHAYSPT